MGIKENIPPHIKQTISVGEEIITTFQGDYIRKSKSSPKTLNDCLMVLTTEKLLIDSEKKKTIEKLSLSNIISVERAGPNKIKLFYSPREELDSKEDIIKLEIVKNKDEKKEDFNKRIDEIYQNIEVFFESADEGSKSEKSAEIPIPNQIIKPSSPLGIPFTPKETKKEEKKEKKITKNKIFCPECGEKLPAGGKFCAACGKKIA